jgi:hypothetical protein
MNAFTLRREARYDALNTSEMVSEQRPVRMAAAIYDVWQVLPGGKAQPHPVQAETLAGIEREIATEPNHGETFMVLETPTLGSTATLHSYRVRRGKWAGRFADAHKIYPHHADKLFAVEVSAFKPVEPWRCVPGADRLGRSGIIEVRHG